ncbi:hypothetical protein ACH4SK_10425 [Streptomyces inhibens]
MTGSSDLGEPGGGAAEAAAIEIDERILIAELASMAFDPFPAGRCYLRA